ncbi:DUF2306 domain-containing protein [Amycolatopsis sp. OK19-0408]|uniref:DUF2306 domain-containing protein n=1 Tax=Amycolatopsis iheyensis TaxID=2945988 RepID=A0A9X2NF81_9PSEU|nr:DUF2306 domain-containing protein [Amycolatopsis iheyensis]MCR6483495.1 DUF2306 domain-containing protein [Amycolatopsis iheyensis]
MSTTLQPPTRSTPSGPDRGATAWWRRPWILPLAAVAVAAVIYCWSTYITFDPRVASVAPLPAEHPMKYPILIAHITFGTIAVLTVVLQVWPWLRRRHPRVHRWAGRVYVVGGVAPSAALAALLLPMIYGPPVFGWLSRVVLAVLWVTTTALGVLAIKRRNVRMHRWFMLSSFALTMDAFSTRFLQIVFMPLYPDVIGRDAFMIIAGWGGWVTNLLLVQAWLFWTARRRRAARAALLPAS